MKGRQREGKHLGKNYCTMCNGHNPYSLLFTGVISYSMLTDVWMKLNESLLLNA